MTYIVPVSVSPHLMAEKASLRVGYAKKGLRIATQNLADVAANHFNIHPTVFVNSINDAQNDVNAATEELAAALAEYTAYKAAA